MPRRSAIKTDLFAADHHREKLDALGDPLVEIAAHIEGLLRILWVTRCGWRALMADPEVPSPLHTERPADA